MTPRTALSALLTLAVISGLSLGIASPRPPSAVAATGCPSGFVLAGSACELTIDASGAWVVPDGITSVDVLVVGGGGGGGGFGLPLGAGGAYGSGGGGGGGQVRVYPDISVAAGQTAEITIGLGGAGGGRASDGSAGQDSTFQYGGSPRTAAGGSGGSKGTSGMTGSEGAGGAGGVDAPTGTGGGAGGQGGNWTSAGTDGTNGRTPSTGLFAGTSAAFGGGGGGGSGYPMDGSRLPGGVGGTGGGGDGGDGGSRSNSPSASSPGSDGRGGGGGGGSQGSRDDGNNYSGARGGDGVVIVRTATVDVCDGSGFSNGDGSSSDPYQISTPSELAVLAADPACFTSHFVQTADITLSGPWTPIGDATNKFAGTYDGAGRSISGLILPQQSYSGLFGATNGATIRNLDVSGGTAADIPALTYSGVLIGDATDTTVANVSITAAIVGVAAVGGAIGQLNGGSVAGVSVTGSIASLQDAVGGLIGAVGTDAAVLSDVSVTSGSVDGSQYVGGVIGRIYGASGDGELTITRMSSSTQVSSSVTNFWQGHVGGAIGSVERHDSSVIITESTASGPVTAITGSWGGGNVGGFAGSIIGRFAVRDTSASGDVAASYAVGGFVGYVKELYGTSSIAGSTAHGNVTAAGSIVGGIGGFLGEGDAASPRAITISQSSASGAVSAPAGTSVGGFGGSVRRSDISESHASGTVTGQYSVGGFIGSSADDIGISDSHASGAVTGEYSVGGFIGSSLNGIGITNAHSSGTVAGGSYVGGLIGRYEGSGTLSEVYATGPVSGGPTGSADGWNVGGLVGIMLNGGTIERAFSTGDVSGVTRVGGLVGELDGPASGTPLQVRDSYATGSVVGSGTLSNVGALVGINRDLLTLERVYATGAVSSSTTTTYRGGVTGVQVTSLTASSVYWNSQTTGMSYAAGTSTDTGEAITGASGLTSRQMRSSSSFVDWNFTAVWGYQCGVSSSPELRWANGQATGLTAGPCTQPGPDNGGGTTPTPVDNPPLVTENPASTTQLGDPMPGAQAPGASELVVDGAPVAVRQTRGPQGRGLALTAGALTISIDPRTASGRALPLMADGTLVVARTGELPVSGSGVAPNAPVDVTLYSTPMQIATTTSDADGAFTMQGLVPRALARGPHTLVVTSTTSDGAPFTLALGVVVTSPASALGANPRLQVQPRSVRPRHPVRMQVTAAQRLCRVTFSLGDRRKSVRADARGRAVITLAAPAKPGPVAASARVAGKGCDALVTRTRFTVRK